MGLPSFPVTAEKQNNTKENLTDKNETRQNKTNSDRTEGLLTNQLPPLARNPSSM